MALEVTGREFTNRKIWSLSLRVVSGFEMYPKISKSSVLYSRGSIERAVSGPRRFTILLKDSLEPAFLMTGFPSLSRVKEISGFARASCVTVSVIWASSVRSLLRYFCLAGVL